MLKRYDSTQSSWVDTTTIKRYDTTQQAWVDVNSVKKYDTTEQAWVEMAYKYIQLDHYDNTENPICYDVENGLGAYFSMVSYPNASLNPRFQFVIEGIDFPAGTKVKFELEGTSNSLSAFVAMHDGTSSLYSHTFNSSDTPNVEIVVPNYVNTRLNRVTLVVKPGTTYSGSTVYCSGYLRNIEIGGVKFKFPDISINE